MNVHRKVPPRVVLMVKNLLPMQKAKEMCGSIPGHPPPEGHGNPLPFSAWIIHGERILWAIVHRVGKESGYDLKRPYTAQHTYVHIIHNDDGVY